MMEVLATAKLAETGAQLTLLGGWALVFGALRMWSARRTGLRLFLMISLVAFALGLTAQSLVRLHAVELNYYPGWKADMDQILGEDHAEFEYSEDDLAIDPVGPREWEGPYWWGQRLGLFLGSLAATGGFLLMGREALAEMSGPRSSKPEGKGER
ncbi:MAG: hypothetical protein VYA27_00215 [Verrucomicrobiota bacterium]|nr:hypothetical protein [Verrucomicrobiota bacterium]